MFLINICIDSFFDPVQIISLLWALCKFSLLSFTFRIIGLYLSLSWLPYSYNFFLILIGTGEAQRLSLHFDWLFLSNLCASCLPAFVMFSLSERFNVRSWHLLLMALAKCCAPMSEMLFLMRFNVRSWQLLMASLSQVLCSSVCYFIVWEV